MMRVVKFVLEARVEYMDTTGMSDFLNGEGAYVPLRQASEVTGRIVLSATVPQEFREQQADVESGFLMKDAASHFERQQKEIRRALVKGAVLL